MLSQGSVKLTYSNGLVQNFWPAVFGTCSEHSVMALLLSVLHTGGIGMVMHLDESIYIIKRRARHHGLSSVFCLCRIINKKD
jgi:hypothetical protein